VVPAQAVAESSSVSESEAPVAEAVVEAPVVEAVESDVTIVPAAEETPEA